MDMNFAEFLKRSRKTVIPSALLAGSLIAAALSATSALAAEFELKFGVITTGTTALYTDFLVPYARAIEAESGGRIAIDIRPQGGFGPQIELLKQLESGEIDIADTLPSYYPARFPRTSVMELPTMSGAAEAGSRIGWTLYEEGLLRDDFADFKLLGLFAGSPYGIMTKDKTVTGLHDLRGMRIRVSGAVVGLALSRLGMIPLGLPSSMLGKALDNSWVDAVNIGFDIAVATPTTPPRTVVDEVSTLIDANLSASIQMLIMNKKRYESLPPDLKAVIDRHSGLKVGVAAAGIGDVGYVAAKQALAANPKYRFFAFSAEDKAEIAQRIAPVLEDWAAGVGAQGIDGAKLLARARVLANAPNS
jgi:TRAP-type C4-dicarboxylate transport system substrate-binding protein